MFSSSSLMHDMPIDLQGVGSQPAVNPYLDPMSSENPFSGVNPQNIPSGSSSASEVERPFTLDDYFDYYNSAKNEDYAYNSAEAQKDREWQEYMSSTAYQRAVADLQAAGLNPWLAVQNGGSGASVGSGAAASSNAASSAASTYAGQIANRTTTTAKLLSIVQSLSNSALNYLSKNSLAASHSINGLFNLIGRLFG